MRRALAALVVLLAGCANEPAHESETSGLPSDYQVPAIAEPLEPGRFAADPCALLTPEERSRLELPDAERNELAGSVECLLRPSGDTVTTVQLKVMTDRGLADLVAQCRGRNAPTACANWAPTTVEQYPAILDTGGQCLLMVGVADQAVLLVNDRTECGRATKIATTALTTLREGT